LIRVDHKIRVGASLLAKQATRFIRLDMLTPPLLSLSSALSSAALVPVLVDESLLLACNALLSSASTYPRQLTP